MSRIAVVALLVLVSAAAGCRDDPGAGSPADRPGVEHQVDDIESTLDRIESELSEG